jgi:hypothetical protein
VSPGNPNYDTSNYGYWEGIRTTHFGSCVAIGQGRIVVAEPEWNNRNNEITTGDSNRTGRAHIYDLDGNHIRTIYPPTYYFASYLYFGGASILPRYSSDGDTDPSALEPYNSPRQLENQGVLAIGSGRIFVGAPEYDHPVYGTSDIGIVFVYTLDGDYIGKIEGPGTSSDAFGQSISVEKGILAIGAPGEDEYGSNEGLVKIYSTPNLKTPYDILARRIGDN